MVGVAANLSPNRGAMAVLHVEHPKRILWRHLEERATQKGNGPLSCPGHWVAGGAGHWQFRLVDSSPAPSLTGIHANHSLFEDGGWSKAEGFRSLL